MEMVKWILPIILAKHSKGWNYRCQALGATIFRRLAYLEDKTGEFQLQHEHELDTKYASMNFKRF